MAAQWIFCVAFSSSVAVVSLEAVLVAGPRSDFTCIASPILVRSIICPKEVHCHKRERSMNESTERGCKGKKNEQRHLIPFSPSRV